MTPEQKQRVRELFLTCCGIPPDGREDFLKQACGDDDLVRREVESLLRSDSEADTFLSSPALGRTFAAANPESLLAREFPAPLDAGTAFGPGNGMPNDYVGQYKLLGVLGRGGMGVVYRAEQENPRRTVALKVIRPGVESREMLKRFRHEGQVLGCLQHPGIAQVYEAGTAKTPHGPQPFFAMELVRGEPLTDFAENNGLDLAGRLRLFVKICEAVQHAHQKGVIHRDLKPGNILVDESGQPKILDFGVARATDADIRTTTLQTDVGQLIGTISYMSPEQIAGDSRELDTRSDIYALGVVLYELLTGRQPHNVSNKTIPQAARIIAEEDPTSLTSIDKSLRGDVETIVLKTLDKDKNRRYQSASDLAADISRYLADEPIAARPATTVYQLRKFARRNKALVGGICATFLALLAGIIGTSVQAVRAAHQRDEADAQRAEAVRQAAIAEAVNDFLNDDLLAAVAPEQQGKDVRMRDVLDAASKTIEGKFSDEPLIESAIRTTLGNTYKKLGDYELAGEHLERALVCARRVLGEEATRTLKAMNNLANVLRLQGKLDEAEKIFVDLLEHRRRVLGDEHPHTLLSMNNLANLYFSQGRNDQAEKLHLETLELRRRLLGEEHPDTLLSMNNLATLYDDDGRFDKAEKLYEHVLDARRKILGPEHPHTLLTMSNLAVLYYSRGRYDKAEPLYRETLRLRRKVLGEEHPATLVSMDNLAILLQRLGRLDEAEPLQIKTLELKLRVLGQENPDTLTSMHGLGVLYESVGKYDQAEPLYEKALELRTRILGEEHPRTLESMNNLGIFRWRQQRPAEAEELLVKTLRSRDRVLGKGHPQTQYTRKFLISVYERLGKSNQVRALYEERLDGYRERATDPNADAADFNAYAWELLTSPLEERRDPHLALAYAEKAVRLTDKQDSGILDTLGLAQHMNGDNDSAVETERKAVALLPPGPSVDRTDFESSLARYLVAAKRFAEAEPLLTTHHRRLLEDDDATRSQVLASSERLAAFYDAWHTVEPGQGYDAKAAEYRALTIAEEKGLP